MGNRPRPLRFSAISLLIALAGLGAAADVAAHAVVYPRVTAPGIYEKYVLRVPNERDIPTVRIELAFPADVRVVSFADVPGWELETRRDEGGRITGAVWTGTLPVGRFVELPFVAVNPDRGTRLEWDAVQAYADGEVVRWTGPEGSNTPASFTEVRDESATGLGAPVLISLGALVLSLIALGLVMRRQSPAA